MNLVITTSTRFQNLNNDSNDLVVKRRIHLSLKLLWALKLLQIVLDLGDFEQKYEWNNIKIEFERITIDLKDN